MIENYSHTNCTVFIYTSYINYCFFNFISDLLKVSNIYIDVSIKMFLGIDFLFYTLLKSYLARNRKLRYTHLFCRLVSPS